MADDAIAFAGALGLQQVDLLGLSMGGFVAQAVVRRAPGLVRRVVLAGTGPAGGVGIDRVTSRTLLAIARGAVTFRNPKTYMFFTSTANGRTAARAFLERLEERTADRDTAVSLGTFRNQLTAIRRWGRQPEWDLTGIRQPVLVANGEQDRIVPSGNSIDLSRRLPDARLVLYPDAGHAGVFQFHEEFVREVLEFLARCGTGSAASMLAGGCRVGRARRESERSRRGRLIRRW